MAAIIKSKLNSEQWVIQASSFNLIYQFSLLTWQKYKKKNFESRYIPPYKMHLQFAFWLHQEKQLRVTKNSTLIAVLSITGGPWRTDVYDPSRSFSSFLGRRIRLFKLIFLFLSSDWPCRLQFLIQIPCFKNWWDPIREWMHGTPPWALRNDRSDHSK